MQTSPCWGVGGLCFFESRMPLSDIAQLLIALAIAAGIVVLASKIPALFADLLPTVIDRLFRRG
jgi:hypothetical protein